MNLTRDEFLARRKAGIGGSDVAAVLGISKFRKNAWNVWHDKVSDVLDDDPETMKDFFGLRSHLEPYVAKLYAEHTGHKVRRRNSLLICEKYPCLHGNIDREILSDERGIGILECKALNPTTFRDIEMHGLPADYSCQIHHYLLAGNGKYSWAAFAIMDCISAKLLTFDVMPDAEFEAQIGEACQSFWDKYVVTKTPPPDNGNALNDKEMEMPKDFTGAVDNLNDNEILSAALSRYDEAVAMRDEAAALVESARDEIEFCMSDHEVAECAGRRIFYRGSLRKSLDTNKLKTENPEIYNKYLKQAEYKKSLRIYTLNNKEN